MGKQIAQGTRNETRIVNLALDQGRQAFRLPKTNTKHEADVVIKGTQMRPAVTWERWIGKKGDGRRHAVRMVGLTEEHWIELLGEDTEVCYGYWVQCKSTQALSMSTVLEGLISWIRERRT